LFSGNPPATNTTISSLNGIGGENWIGGTRAPGGSGTNNSGIITSAFIILPASLTSFSATEIENGVQLRWTTENENKSRHYQIQASGNGVDFKTIGSTNAEVNNSYTQQYSFVHAKIPASTIYYRLKILDADGRISYSKVTAIRQAESPALSVSIFPNPALVNPTLNIKCVENGEGIVSVLNMHGSVLSNQKLKLNKGDNNVVLESVNKLPAAVYNIRLSIKGKSMYTRLIIQK
ncbi:MAG: T9SS type A sorting domain-containing protein, partial [Chitinophagaceae bacterium]